MNVWVKVVGFSSEERHAIQTMLRLSQEGDVRLRWWSPERGVAPHVILLDAESHAAALEIQSPSFNPGTKSIVVGDGGVSIAGMWRRFERPLDWAQMLREFETLFMGNAAPVQLSEPCDSLPAFMEDSVPPGYKTALIVGLAREEQMYLKARLSLQGIAHVDEVANASDAVKNMGQHRYDVLIIGCPLPDVDVPTFIQALHERHEAPVEIVAVMGETQWQVTQSMESLGVLAVLETPFTPHRVGAVFAQL